MTDGTMFTSARSKMRALGSGTAGAARRSSDLVLHRVLRRAYFWVEHNVDVMFDRLAGIETVSRAHLDELTIDSDNTDFGDDEEIYVAVPVLALKAMDRVLPDEVDDLVFVDLGSGKGRVLVYASGRWFHRIIGVEFAAELHSVASENIERGRHPRQRCADIEVVHGDAVEFEIPDDPCVFFLFNPFERPVLEQVVDNIRVSFERNPRPMYVLYHNPVFAKAFDEIDLFERAWSRTRSRRSECYEVIAYRTRFGHREPTCRTSELTLSRSHRSRCKTDVRRSPMCACSNPLSVRGSRTCSERSGQRCRRERAPRGKHSGMERLAISTTTDVLVCSCVADEDRHGASVVVGSFEVSVRLSSAQQRSERRYSILRDAAGGGSAGRQDEGIRVRCRVAGSSLEM